MTNTEYLKTSYKRHLKAVAVLNLIIFWGVVVSAADFSEVGTLLASLSLEHAITALIAPIATFVLDGLLSADAKARLIFWRYMHPLPGSRIRVRIAAVSMKKQGLEAGHDL